MGITNPAEQHFERGLWGFDGSVWRKVGLPFAYEDRWAERQTDTASGVETIQVKTTAVPAGFVYVFQACAVVNTGSSCARVRVEMYGGGAFCLVLDNWNPVQSVPDIWSGVIVLKEGDEVVATFTTCTDGNACYLDVRGYKMAVT